MHLPANMTRAHFERIAAELRSQAATDPAGHAARVSAMADRLRSTNPHFIRASQPGTDYRDKSTRSITRNNAAKKLSGFLAGVTP